jgi:hypothetical protein
MPHARHLELDGAEGPQRRGARQLDGLVAAGRHGGAARSRRG